MSDDASELPTTVTPSNDESPSPKSAIKSQIIIESLAGILSSSAITSLDPRDPDTYAAISAVLRRTNSGAGDDEICRWLYDAFQSGDPDLRLVVLNHVPVLAGAYLSRAALRRPLPGFEAVLLALYAYEAGSRAGMPVTITLPDLSQPSLYHESASVKSGSSTPDVVIVSPTLDPCGTVRSTRRAMIVGVALELYFGNVHAMPKESKLDFCRVCRDWAGRSDEGLAGGSDGGSIRLPWELLQPIMRILGHCIVGYWANDEKVRAAAKEACGVLHVRAIRDINAKAILATETLLRLGNLNQEPTAKKIVDDDDRVGVAEVSID